jgi:cytidylate kinase
VERRWGRAKRLPKHPVIAIDGPAGSGKSTAARLLARKLGYTHVDTGALYRTVTLLAIERGVDLADETTLAAVVPFLQVRFEPSGEGQRVLSGSRDVSRQIRTPELTRQVRFAAGSPAVRQALVPVQREFAERGPCVMEGRDIGTVIFPDAQVKFYLDAPLRVRAERRWRELAAAGKAVTLEEVEREEAARDESDLKRSTAPLRRADDAIVVDTGEFDIAGMVEHLARLAAERLGKFPGGRG